MDSIHFSKPKPNIAPNFDVWDLLPLHQDINLALGHLEVFCHLWDRKDVVVHDTPLYVIRFLLKLTHREHLSCFQVVHYFNLVQHCSFPFRTLVIDNLLIIDLM